MFTTNRPDATFFSLPQLKAIMAWSAERPHGFQVRIMTDYDQCPEMAELLKYGRRGNPSWFVNVTLAGTTVITDASGADEELGTVEEALARVLALDA